MKSVLLTIAAAMALFAACPAQAAAANDGWQGVKCNAPVPAALIGKTMKNEPVVQTEARHKDIMLHDLGASEINDNLNAVSWTVCGKEYMVLEDNHDVVRDVLAFPAHSKEHPEFLGMCRKDGKDTPEQIAAVLDNTGANAGKPTMPAMSAWRIDEHTVKFVVMPVQGLTCGRDGIITADGGM